MNKKEKIFRDNCGNDFFFILLLSISLAVLVSKLAIVVMKETIALSTFGFASAHLFVYLFTASFAFIYYYTKKLEEIE